MFKINVKRTLKYVEVIIQTGLVTVESGLLDEKESIELAKEFLYSAENLLPASLSEQELKIIKVREKLEVLIDQ